MLESLAGNQQERPSFLMGRRWVYLPRSSGLGSAPPGDGRACWTAQPVRTWCPTCQRTARAPKVRQKKNSPAARQKLPGKVLDADRPRRYASQAPFSLGNVGRQTRGPAERSAPVPDHLPRRPGTVPRRPARQRESIHRPPTRPDNVHGDAQAETEGKRRQRNQTGGRGGGTKAARWSHRMRAL